MRIIQQFARMDKCDGNYRPFKVIWCKHNIGFTTMNLSRCLVSSRETQIILSKNARKMETLAASYGPYYIWATSMYCAQISVFDNTGCYRYMNTKSHIPYLDVVSATWDAVSAPFWVLITH